MEHRALGALSTIDGQHRVLGVDLELKELTATINKLERDLVRAQRAERKATLQGEIDRNKAQLASLERESVGLDIYVEPDNVNARQMFVDVADNAKGISSALSSRFDGSKIANRALDWVVDHALLKGRVGLEQDRMTAKNPNLMGRARGELGDDQGDQQLTGRRDRPGLDPTGPELVSKVAEIADSRRDRTRRTRRHGASQASASVRVSNRTPDTPSASPAP